MLGVLVALQHTYRCCCCCEGLSSNSCIPSHCQQCEGSHPVSSETECSWSLCCGFSKFSVTTERQRPVISDSGNFLTSDVKLTVHYQEKQKMSWQAGDADVAVDTRLWQLSCFTIRKWLIFRIKRSELTASENSNWNTLVQFKTNINNIPPRVWDRTVAIQNKKMLFLFLSTAMWLPTIYFLFGLILLWAGCEGIQPWASKWFHQRLLLFTFPPVISNAAEDDLNSFPVFCEQCGLCLSDWPQLSCYSATGFPLLKVHLSVRWKPVGGREGGTEAE